MLSVCSLCWSAENVAVDSGGQVAPQGGTATATAIPPSPPSPPARGPALSLAIKAAEKAISRCQNLDQKVAVSIVDSGGIVRVLLASDGAAARAVQSGTNKALTALAFKKASSEIGEQIKTDLVLAKEIAANPNYNTRAGGILLQVRGEIIGAIGVGGARGSEKDEACAIAGLKEIEGQFD